MFGLFSVIFSKKCASSFIITPLQKFDTSRTKKELSFAQCLASVKFAQKSPIIIFLNLKNLFEFRRILIVSNGISFWISIFLVKLVQLSEIYQIHSEKFINKTILCNKILRFKLNGYRFKIWADMNLNRNFQEFYCIKHLNRYSFWKIIG